MSNLIKEQKNNEFLLVMIDEEQYIEHIQATVKSLEKEGAYIVYICLSRPYADVLKSLKEKGIKTGAFIFVDVLSSHYGTPDPVKNCIFIDNPQNLNAIQKAINQIMNKKKLHALIFDTVSAMLIYQKIFPILKFTNELGTETRDKSVKKIYFVLKTNAVMNEENERMIKDLKLFADKLIEPPLDKTIKA